jgi:hypothetical protein
MAVDRGYYWKNHGNFLSSDFIEDSITGPEHIERRIRRFVYKED